MSQKKQWAKLIRDYSVKNKKEIMTDIGLGKRQSVMVAHQLQALENVEIVEEEEGVVSKLFGKLFGKTSKKPLDTITIRGSEGMNVQFAACCRPIPGDPILGYINKDKGLIIHTHDCQAISKFRLDPDKWLDVDWDSDNKHLFKVNLRMVVENKPGMLAMIAGIIADAGSNIDNVNMEEADNSIYTGVNFTVQVRDRVHLADLMRAIRKIPSVVSN